MVGGVRIRPESSETELFASVTWVGWSCSNFGMCVSPNSCLRGPVVDVPKPERSEELRDRIVGSHKGFKEIPGAGMAPEAEFDVGLED